MASITGRRILENSWVPSMIDRLPFSASMNALANGEWPPPDCLQPLIPTHPETGRKAIYISPAYIVRIEGLANDDSEALKKEIYGHCLRDRFRMRYIWRTGDVVAWDNASLMHSATTKELDPAKPRTL